MDSKEAVRYFKTNPLAKEALMLILTEGEEVLERNLLTCPIDPAKLVEARSALSGHSRVVSFITRLLADSKTQE